MQESSSPEVEVDLEEAEEATEVAEVEEATRAVRRESSTDPREPSKRRVSNKKRLVIITTVTRLELMDTRASHESNTIHTIDKTALVEATRDKRKAVLVKQTGVVKASSFTR
jgi:hypothetical protein